MRALKQAGGNWVAGDDRFWNREHEVAQFIENLDEGSSLYLVAQRRIGKTSLMREVARRIEHRYVCLHLDLQKAKSPEDLIVELSKSTHPHKTLWMKTREVFGNILGAAANSVEALEIDEVSLKIREGLLRSNWHAKGDRLLAALAASDKPVVLFMDEVPILVNRILKGPDYQITPERTGAVDEFMSWLRKNSIEHRDQIRFVVTGSIGFEPILRQAGLSATINNFKPFLLEPWDADVAMGCLDALARSYEITYGEGARERVTELLGCCIPHHVQMFFSHIYDMCKRRSVMTCDRSDVDEVFDKRMLSTRGHAELSTFEERLRMMVDGRILPFVLDLLTEAAVMGRLTPQALRFYRGDHGLDDRNGRAQARDVLDILEHDGYLRQQGQEYVFVSHLLGEWWKRRFGFDFIMAEQREAEHDRNADEVQSGVSG